MNFGQLLMEIGISAPITTAGFWGGIVAALVTRKMTLSELFTSIIVGAMTANYLGAVAVRYTGAPELPTGFIVGMTGMAVCRGIIAAVNAIRIARIVSNSNGKAPDGTAL